MDIKGMLAAALRNFAPGAPTAAPDAAKSQFGQDGVAKRVNPRSRAAFLQYAEQEIAEGREPVRFDQWIAQQAGG